MKSLLQVTGLHSSGKFIFNIEKNESISEATINTNESEKSIFEELEEALDNATNYIKKSSKEAQIKIKGTLRKIDIIDEMVESSRLEKLAEQYHEKNISFIKNFKGEPFGPFRFKDNLDTKDSKAVAEEIMRYQKDLNNRYDLSIKIDGAFGEESKEATDSAFEIEEREAKIAKEAKRNKEVTFALDTGLKEVENYWKAKFEKHGFVVEDLVNNSRVSYNTELNYEIVQINYEIKNSNFMKFAGKLIKERGWNAGDIKKMSGFFKEALEKIDNSTIEDFLNEIPPQDEKLSIKDVQDFVEMQKKAADLSIKFLEETRPVSFDLKKIQQNIKKENEEKVRLISKWEKEGMSFSEIAKKLKQI